MSFISQVRGFAVSAVIALACGSFAAEVKPLPPEKPATPVPVTDASVKPTASDASAARTKAGEALKAKEQAVEQRDRYVKEYEALVKQLKDATEAQKKEILAKMQDRKKAFEEAQSALHKQIRDEQRRQRQNSAPKR